MIVFGVFTPLPNTPGFKVVIRSMSDERLDEIQATIRRAYKLIKIFIAI
jgi:hypothetical protein